ncbi:phosphohistidine phosphatase, SixA [Stanieria cyanosphaera PCC 7437]|uniref:Phosphohistidine phosphatase, SixA n=1 Tax=Stanieria cyanosphaera (strain ATCC 29371 / PCC 7437) TaxID=111780 RepID=K9Y196_STAC7|nr:phosphohistidine phosphatase SixA [Stanieria cyanosphaera]AFZ37742.1 phosphohistidine phosphatase, SixA [Stanieria cyanosphaera PCC 7437]
MEVYLIRHGIAAERGTYTNDDERPLIEKGRIKTKQVAEKLRAINLKFDLILTSPLIRAHQTAEIFQKVGLTNQIEIFESLAPDSDINKWLEWYSQFSEPNSNCKLALVGHQPDLGNWTEMLVWGTVKEQIVVKKAGIVGLNVPKIENPLGKSELFLLTSPKWLI